MKMIMLMKKKDKKKVKALYKEIFLRVKINFIQI